MIHITAFDQQRKPAFSVSLSDVTDAARAALCAVRNTAFPFAKIVNGKGSVVISGNAPPGVKRLAHAIETQADMALA